MTVRDSFVAHFGEANATRVEEASLGHINDLSNGDVHKDDSMGTDPFQYALLNCVSRDCFTQWSDYHGFQGMPIEDVRTWAITHAHLHEFDGDIPDYLGLFAGAYHPWLNWEEMGQEMPTWAQTAADNQSRWEKMPTEQLIQELQTLAAEGMRLLNHHDPKEG
jgi:hypothetical protein